ncbi:MAG TPA: hypothetical protein VIL35_15705 [Vicinamibacterales bacterium]
MAHPSPSAHEPASSSRVSPFDLVCVAVLFLLLWWIAQSVAAVSARGLPHGTSPAAPHGAHDPLGH